MPSWTFVIYYLGYVPRDVFAGMSRLGRLKVDHLAALDVTYAQLHEIVVTFITGSRLPNNNKATLQRIPEAGSLVGHMIEPFVHRLLTNKREGDPCPLLEMRSNDVEHTPTFTVDPSAAASSGTLGFPQLQRKVERIGSRIPTSLAHGTYHSPKEKSPLVDAFTVESDNATCSAILWLFQVINPEHYDGSGRGYIWIRKLITTLQDELESRRQAETSSPEKHEGSSTVPRKRKREDNERKTKNPEVSVRYVLSYLNDLEEKETPRDKEVRKEEAPEGGFTLRFSILSITTIATLEADKAPVNPGS
ncbi:hypothetical protein L226DRAFT_518768 [Lentinus tigrinus ALCF2SS1-7]|uniref:Uncharacterized protein n=1 Tax=Lentinus tigrinus ALCF2SS1-6 TaxID=1328759 RepID=A0A5C2SL42_9APHY|nr:hypothetical protein L227DRAFT_560445 [Lentinus tigrinus ALCF2SS1-6]RPD82924.1 hypothetical protein L226DRAFT_518768 [Lentinus tigrinus ALCF2SS1-7]